MIAFIPTDTCYGMAASCIDSSAYQRIYALKGRDFTKPLSVVVRDFSALRAALHVSDDQLEYLRQYPYPWTLLASARDGDLALRAWSSRGCIAARMGSNCLSSEVQRLLWPEGTEGAYFLTSANRSWETECQTSQECRAVFWSQLLPEDRIFEGRSGGGKGSNIFSFEGDSLWTSYLRKNYGI